MVIGKRSTFRWKREGERTESWGTPALMGKRSYCDPLITARILGLEEVEIVRRIDAEEGQMTEVKRCA